MQPLVRKNMRKIFALIAALLTGGLMLAMVDLAPQAAEAGVKMN